MPRAIDIPAGETRSLVDDSDPMGRYEFDVVLGEILVSDRKADAPEGRRVGTLRPGYFVKDENTEEIYAHADPDIGAAAVEIAKSRFEINLFPPATLKAEKQNKPALAHETDSVDQNGQQLGDQPAPDGFEVTVQARVGNSDPLQITNAKSGPVAELNAGQAFSAAVDNFNALRVEALGPSFPEYIASVESNEATGGGT
jgi:hypothetical protein